MGYSGAGERRLRPSACAPTRVETLIVDGRVVVENHELKAVKLDPVIKRHRRLAARMVGGEALL